MSDAFDVIVIGAGHNGIANAAFSTDRAVGLAEKNGIEIICRLDNPPAWSRADGDARGTLIPPDDYADYGDFVHAVVSRYRGRIRYYQIWNEPNLVREWGTVSASAYTALLEVAVTNTGKSDLQKLHAAAEAPWFRREFAFGRVAPGETRSWSAEARVGASGASEIRVPSGLRSRDGGWPVMTEARDGRVQEAGL